MTPRHIMSLRLLGPVVLAALSIFCVSLSSAQSTDRPRVIVSTDIGGTDFDDHQSMVHVLLYADVLDLEGLLSSPYGPGRKEHILEVIAHYERDYPQLRAHSDRYPTANALRAITKQGETETAPYTGVRRASEGSDWIIACARRPDTRPLHVLVWGGIEDVAQALHDAPDILPKLRVYFIGGPNKKWSPDAYHSIATNHPTLWMIESNATYRGWFTGGNPSGDLAPENFAAAHAAGRGALGDFFAHGIRFENQTRSVVKMGDSPTVSWLLRGDSTNPAQPGWGGRYVRAWKRPYIRFDHLTNAADQMELFGILELVLPLGANAPAAPEARLLVENQSLIGHITDGRVHFRFCPKDAKTYRYKIQSNAPELNDLSGEITSVAPSMDAVLTPDDTLPNWWTDFAARLERCKLQTP
jgi:hypothetical protein